MANNKTIKVKLTIRKDLDVDEFLDELNEWMMEKDFINPFFSKREK